MEISRTINNYQKQVNQLKSQGVLSQNQLARAQKAFEMLNKFQRDAMNGQDVQHYLKVWTGELDKVLGSGNRTLNYNTQQANAAADARRRAENPYMRQSSGGMEDNYLDSDTGYAHFGNGDAYRA